MPWIKWIIHLIICMKWIKNLRPLDNFSDNSDKEFKLLDIILRPLDKVDKILTMDEVNMVFTTCG